MQVTTFDGMQIIITNFQPSDLNFCPDLEELDISNRLYLDPVSFVLSVVNCKNLKIIKFVNCRQFTEEQITYMLWKLKKLQYIDGTRTQAIRFCNFLSIITSLRKLRCISLEPKFPVEEQKDWIRVVKNYPLVFGHAINRIVPFAAK